MLCRCSCSFYTRAGRQARPDRALGSGRRGHAPQGAALDRLRGEGGRDDAQLLAALQHEARPAVPAARACGRGGGTERRAGPAPCAPSQHDGLRRLLLDASLQGTYDLTDPCCEFLEHSKLLLTCRVCPYSYNRSPTSATAACAARSAAAPSRAARAATATSTPQGQTRYCTAAPVDQQCGCSCLAAECC